MAGGNTAASEAELEQLRLQLKRYDDITAFAGRWAWEVDAEGIYTFAGPSVKAVFGYTPQQIVGRSIFDFVVPKEREDFERVVAELIGQCEPFRTLLSKKRTGNGAAIWVFSSAIPVFDDNGELIAYRGTDTDVTARKQAEDERLHQEQQLEQLHKLQSLQRMAGGIAHDFNNILMILMGNVDLAMLELPADSPAAELMSDLQTATHRMRKHCEDLMAYAGKTEANLEALCLNELVDVLHKTIRHRIPANVSLYTDCDPDLPKVNVDREAMLGLLDELFSNALDAVADEGGAVTISTEVMECSSAWLSETYLNDELPEGKYVLLKVADTGQGIPNSIMPSIFDPFFADKPNHKGRGLARCMGVLRANGGGVRVDTAPRRGTTVTALLPVAPAGA